MRIMIAGIGLGLAAAGPVQAQAQAQVQDRLVGCLAEVEDAKRLACYDAVVKGLSADARRVSEAREAEAAKAKAAAAAAEARAAAAAAAAAEEARRDTFGKPADSAEEIREVSAGIREILRDASGKPVFILDNDQMWRQADGFSLPSAKVGAKVTVKRGAMGSYRLLAEGSKRSVQVIRMR